MPRFQNPPVVLGVAAPNDRIIFGLGISVFGLRAFPFLAGSASLGFVLQAWDKVTSLSEILRTNRGYHVSSCLFSLWKKYLLHVISVCSVRLEYVGQVSVGSTVLLWTEDDHLPCCDTAPYRGIHLRASGIHHPSPN